MIIRLLILAVLCGWTQTVRAAEFIAFSHLSGDGYWQIWQMHSDGSNARAVTTSAQDKREPFVTHDGRLVYRTNNGQAFVSALDGSSEEEILKDYPRVNNMQFTHDGNSIVFTRYDPRFKDIRDIWKTDQDGQNAVVLTRDNHAASHPSLSWDDASVAFVKKADDGSDYHHIWLMDADGHNARALTSGKAQDLGPRFSPDKERIVFSSNRNDGNFEIYAVSVKDKTLKRLTNDPGLDTDPCFSVDGKRIAFVSNRGGRQQIWVMNNDGSNPAVLTQLPGESIEPVWAQLN